MRLIFERSGSDPRPMPMSQECDSEPHTLATVYRYVLNCHARREYGRKHGPDNPDATQAGQIERRV